MLRDLKSHVPALAISFDSMDQAVVARTTGEAGATGFVERFASMGAPGPTASTTSARSRGRPP